MRRPHPKIGSERKCQIEKGARRTTPIFESEAEVVLRHVTARDTGPLSSEAPKRVLEVIIDEMRTIQCDHRR